MKKAFFVSVVFFAMATATHAQEKGLHLNLGGSFGRTYLKYDLNEGSYHWRMGYGGYLGAQYFFNYHWGLSLSGEFFVFNTQSRYNQKLFNFQGIVDDEGHDCELAVRLRNWKENQTTYFVEIPLMGLYQNKFGRKERHGFYLGLGLKAQIPVFHSYERAAGEIRVSGYYPQWELYLGEEGRSVELPQHAYGTNGNRAWNGAHNLKTSFALVGEAGFLIGLSSRIDLTLGVSADYGLTNISKKNDDLLGPIAGRTQQEGSYIAEMIYYNGILNSNQTQYINTISIRGKVGLRIKIGKLKEKNDTDSTEESSSRGGRRNKMEGNDTIFVYPVIVYQQPDQDGNGGAGQGGVGGNNNMGTNGYGQGGGGGYGGASGRPPIPAMYGSLPPEAIAIFEQPIYFDLAKSTLRKESKRILDEKVKIMQEHPYAVLTVVGHTCNLGAEAKNDKLSYDRADEARFYLIEKGISPSRIIAIPRGQKNPKYPNTSEADREKNRRVDFYLSEH